MMGPPSTALFATTRALPVLIQQLIVCRVFSLLISMPFQIVLAKLGFMTVVRTHVWPVTTIAHLALQIQPIALPVQALTDLLQHPPVPVMIITLTMAQMPIVFSVHLPAKIALPHLIALSVSGQTDKLVKNFF
jgi:hypothetical protein